MGKLTLWIVAIFAVALFWSLYCWTQKWSNYRELLTGSEEINITKIVKENPSGKEAISDGAALDYLSRNLRDAKKGFVAMGQTYSVYIYLNTGRNVYTQFIVSGNKFTTYVHHLRSYFWISDPDYYSGSLRVPSPKELRRVFDELK